MNQIVKKFTLGWQFLFDNRTSMNQYKTGMENTQYPFFEIEDRTAPPPYTTEQKFAIMAFVIDALLLNLSFVLMSLLRRPEQYIDNLLGDFLLMINGLWLLSGALMKKYELKNFYPYSNGLMSLSRSVMALLFFSGMAIILFGYYSYSRYQFFGGFVIYYVLCALFFSLIYFTCKSRLFPGFTRDKDRGKSKVRVALRFMAFDLFTLLTSFFLVNYLKHGSLVLSIEYERLLIIILSVWFIAAVSTRKFDKRIYKNIYYAVTPLIKSFIIVLALTSLVLLSLGNFNISRLQFFGSLLLFFVIELVAYAYSYLRKQKLNGDTDDITVIKDTIQRETNEAPDAKSKELKSSAADFSIKEKLRSKYLKSFPSLYNFIEQNIDLQTITESDTVVMNTRTRYNIQILDDQSVNLLINLHKINDFRWLNRYFLEVHRKIETGGYFVGQAHTLHTHQKWFYEKFPGFLANILFPIDFVFRRLMPKLPGFKIIYFVITKGKNRLISKAETLGRLYFCGFRIINVGEIDHRMFYIARKVKQPSGDSNPSYGPLIKLRRIGLDGKLIHLLKFRTMHPYSEYLQEYVYIQNQLQQNGKFNSDFRITEWGKWFRKLWIDELPQLINFVQGDVSLVGVRAISPHYFSLYPKDLQKLRVQFKPGLVPPYYADMPNSFEEILESERRYLEQKQQRPFITDIRYFCKAIYNIVFKHARSH